MHQIKDIIHVASNATKRSFKAVARIFKLLFMISLLLHDFLNTNKVRL